MSLASMFQTAAPAPAAMPETPEEAPDFASMSPSAQEAIRKIMEHFAGGVAGGVVGGVAGASDAGAPTPTAAPPVPTGLLTPKTAAKGMLNHVTDAVTSSPPVSGSSVWTPTLTPPVGSNLSTASQPSIFNPNADLSLPDKTRIDTSGVPRTIFQPPSTQPLSANTPTVQPPTGIGEPPANFNTILRDLNTRVDKLTGDQKQHFEEWLKASSEESIDPATGKPYKLPEVVGIEKMIGGKHTFGDLVILLGSIIALASGRNGQQFGAGLLQGALGGKQQLAQGATEAAQQKFAYEQQARAQKANQALKILGYDDQQIGQLMNHMDRVMGQKLAEEARVRTADETKTKDKNSAYASASDDYRAANSREGMRDAASRMRANLLPGYTAPSEAEVDAAWKARAQRTAEADAFKGAKQKNSVVQGYLAKAGMAVSNADHTAAASLYSAAYNEMPATDPNRKLIGEIRDYYAGNKTLRQQYNDQQIGVKQMQAQTAVIERDISSNEAEIRRVSAAIGTGEMDPAQGNAYINGLRAENEQFRSDRDSLVGKMATPPQGGTGTNPQQVGSGYDGPAHPATAEEAKRLGVPIGALIGGIGSGTSGGSGGSAGSTGGSRQTPPAVSKKPGATKNSGLNPELQAQGKKAATEIERLGGQMARNEYPATESPEGAAKEYNYWVDQYNASGVGPAKRYKIYNPKSESFSDAPMSRPHDYGPSASAQTTHPNRAGSKPSAATAKASAASAIAEVRQRYKGADAAARIRGIQDHLRAYLKG